MKTPCSIPAILGFALLSALPPIVAANAAEIKIFTARLGATVLREIGPQFERESGHRLNVTEIYGPQFMKRINAGEPLEADVVILRFDLVDILIKDGELLAESRTDLMRTGLGVEMRAGARTPDISSVEAFKRALPTAKSIAYLANGVETTYLDGLLARFGIAEAVKPKLTRPTSDIVSALTARGEVELGIAIITQIMTTPGVEFVGPLPHEIQSFYHFTGAVSATSKVADAAKELIKFLTGPAAIPVIRSQGMEPG
jgi:molybdate transport system substrate-binding protein